MNKNNRRQLKTNDDYSSWANGCYKQANEFYNIVLRCRDMLMSESMCSVFTNVAFACELYLKHLLFDSKIDCRGEHNLYRLYCKLPEKIKITIKNLHPCGNTSKDRFEDELKNIGEAFTVFRYSYEISILGWNGQFLLEFLQ